MTSHPKIEPKEFKEKLPSILLKVKLDCVKRHTSLSKLSRLMGRSPNYYSYQLRRKSPSILTILELTELLRINYVEIYLSVLSPALRKRVEEKELQRERAEKEKEIRTLKAENEKLWATLASKT